MSENLVRTLINTPKHLLEYFAGLVISTLDDYTLITLLIFAVLSGVALESILLGFVVYFGGYFLVRLVSVVNDALGFGAIRLSNSVASLNPDRAGQVPPSGP